MMRQLIVAGFFCFMLCAAFASGEADWALTTADFRTQNVQLKGLGAAGLTVVPAGGGAARTVPLDQFLDVQRSLAAPAQIAGKFVLHMTGGDRIGGEPRSLTADALLWQNPALGEISIPTAGLIAITNPAVTAPPPQQHEDVVTLANGDSIRGIIAAIVGDKVTVQTASGNTDVPVASVASIAFAATPGAAAPKRGFRVRLDDGSSLVGADATLGGANAGDSLILTLGKNVQRNIALAHVAAIEQVNGPVSWLSSRAPVEAIYFPFVGARQEPAAYMDRAWLGRGPIEFRGRTFPHGIGVHAYSRLSWPLDGKYAAFRTRYAVDGDAILADVVVRILLDDKVVYEQKNVRAGNLSPVVIEDLKGARRLTLEVDGRAAYVQDSLSWIQPALLKDRPAPEPAGPVATAPSVESSATRPATAPAAQPGQSPQ